MIGNVIDRFKGINFHSPWAFLLLLLPIGYAVWYIYQHRLTFASFKTSGAGDAIDELPTSLKAKLRHLPVILHLVGLGVLVIALARPQKRDNWESNTVEGIDILVAMDVSTSMLATDFSPNRLTVSKKMAVNFVEKRENDRIGLVVFAGESFTQCPLTTDHSVLNNLLMDIRTGLLEDGTALGDGLATAITRLKDSDGKSKVVVILTDGVNNRGSVSPITAAQIAEAYKVKVYTIGIGTNKEYSITPQGKMKNEIDEKTLQEVAKATGGKYFRAKSAKELANVYEEIDKLETSEISVTEYQNYKELFLIPSLIGFALVLFGVVLKNTILRTIP